MAPNRSSRSKKHSRRSSQVKRANLHEPKVIDGKDRVTRRKERETRREREAASNVSLLKVRVRPAGGKGLATILLGTIIICGGVLAAAWGAGRWFVMGYPDTLWLYLAIGMLASSAGVGFIARSMDDVRTWTILTATLASIALIGEIGFGPSCPAAAACGTVGARGSLGLPLTVCVIALATAATYGLGRVAFRRAIDRRPAAGRISLRIALGGMLISSALLGLPVALAVVGTDLALRPEPGFARTARTVSMEDAECFPISQAPPRLYARANPVAVSTEWSSFAVGRVHENRHTGADGKRLPASLVSYGEVSPYEAVVTIDNATGDTVSVTCRRLSATAGRATKADAAPLAADKIKSENPLNPPRPGGSSADILQQPTAPETPAAARKSAKATAGK